MQNHQTIIVSLWGKEIGQLSWNDRTKRSYFFFSKEYFTLPYDICPITSPKDSPETKIAIYGNTEVSIYKKLPPFLADSLPDSWGNDIFDRWFAENGLKEKDKNPITKLSFIGRRAMGALEFYPCVEFERKNEKVDLCRLYEKALLFEQTLSDKSIQLNPDMSFADLAAVGTSAGGRQMKAIVTLDQEGIFHSGQTDNTPGHKSLIIKFGSRRYTFSEIEYVYYLMARNAEIDMTACDLIDLEGVKCFVTERFDRKDGEKLFTQTLAAINPEGEESYENLFKTAELLGLPYYDKEQIFKRMVFNVLANNTDDHNKNFSFVMDKSGLWRLSPAYDMTFILDRSGIRAQEERCFCVRGKKKGIEKNDLLSLASENGIKNAEKVIEKVSQSLQQFGELATKYGIASDIAEIINERICALKASVCGEKVDTKENTKKDFQTKDGHLVSDIRFERTFSGNIHLYAQIDGIERRYVIRANSKEAERIIEQGFNSMPDEGKRSLVEKYFLPSVSVN